MLTDCLFYRGKGLTLRAFLRHRLMLPCQRQALRLTK
jgi:hypothetical protein